MDVRSNRPHYRQACSIRVRKRWFRPVRILRVLDRQNVDVIYHPADINDLDKRLGRMDPVRVRWTYLLTVNNSDLRVFTEL